MRLGLAFSASEVVRAVALSLAALSLTASCGARTELAPSEEPCAALGETRPCQNTCGMGLQRCGDGIWGSCEVSPTSRSCSDACGLGTQVCEAGVWKACAVPTAERACSNACGAGQETCREGAWGACEVNRVAVPCQSVCGAGEEICERGTWRACNAPEPKPPKLFSIVRDFNDTHPDFEIPASGNWFEPGLVQLELGPDDKPVYANRAASRTTSGAANFDQWYRDVPGVNLALPLDLQLAPSPLQPGLFVYDDHAFFPIDQQLFGNQGRRHNYHFTLEASTRFQYLGGEVFRFSGDDDMWVFINRRLAIDLGGIHRSMSEEVNLDAQATRLGLIRGETYPLHFFFAERHTTDSNFTIETSISEPGSCD